MYSWSWLIFQPANRSTRSRRVSMLGTRSRDTSTMTPRTAKSGQSTT